VTLTFDLLKSELMHAEVLPRSLCVPSLVSIARVVFLLERGHTQSATQTVTDATDQITLSMHRLPPAWVMNATFTVMEYHRIQLRKKRIEYKLVKTSK